MYAISYMINGLLTRIWWLNSFGVFPARLPRRLGERRGGDGPPARPPASPHAQPSARPPGLCKEKVKLADHDPKRTSRHRGLANSQSRSDHANDA